MQLDFLNTGRFQLWFSGSILSAATRDEAGHFQTKTPLVAVAQTDSNGLRSFAVIPTTGDERSQIEASDGSGRGASLNLGSVARAVGTPLLVRAEKASGRAGENLRESVFAATNALTVFLTFDSTTGALAMSGTSATTALALPVAENF